jgi:2'-5' RNA ligase
MQREPEALLALYRELSEALRASEVRFEDLRQFRPHVTLARDAAPPADALFTPLTWHAHRIVLVQSSAQPGGSGYRVIAARDLDLPCRTITESGPA